MTNSALSRRLDWLETRLLPADSGVTEHTIVFVDGDGVKTDSMVLKFSDATTDRDQRERPWRRRRGDSRGQRSNYR
jgi:hypothetical protein